MKAVDSSSGFAPSLASFKSLSSKLSSLTIRTCRVPPSVANVGEAQQIVGFISIAAVTPLGLIFLFVLNPDSVLSVALTLLPLTSPFVLLMRWQVTTVPLWQMLLSWLLLGGATALSVYATGRLLHRGMLRSGQRLSLAEVAGALRPWAGQRR